MTALLLVAVLVVGIVLERRLCHVQEDLADIRRETVLNDRYTTLYPVFSERDVHQTYAGAEAMTKNAKEVEAAFLADPAVEKERGQRRISDATATRMLQISRDHVAVEARWYRHAAMMEANLAVVSGRLGRDESRKVADEKLYSPLFELDVAAEGLRDQWRARLVGDGGAEESEQGRRYSNPWYDQRR
jgi:hypothetical protein